MSPEDLERTNQHAQKMIADGKKNDAMPTSLVPFIFTSPITAYRWNSLAAKGGDDDYFSADLEEATIKAKFGRVDRPILILPGEEDELVPSFVDKKELLSRWVQACPEGTVSKLSALVPKADHEISHPEAQERVCDSIMPFIDALRE
jgi:alpha-beta hydrolase superfamily lysophospholipase